METIKVNQTKAKTLKDVAKIFNISIKKASFLKREIENQYNAPSFMVWGTGDKKGYSLHGFAEKLNVKIEIIKTPLA
jgi:hypothetical protein